MAEEPSQPSPPPPVAPPPAADWSQVPQPTPPAAPQDQIGRLVPTRNPKALLSYYLGLFSIFPLFGLFMGAIAIVAGRQGLQLFKEHPQVEGATHAKVGIGCGLIGLLVNLSLILLFVAALLSRPGKFAGIRSEEGRDRSVRSRQFR